MEKNGIGRKTFPAYALRSKGRVEMMVGFIERGVGKIVRTHSLNWDLASSKPLCEDRRHHFTTGLSSYELIFGVVSQMPMEHSDRHHYGDSAAQN